MNQTWKQIKRRLNIRTDNSKAERYDQRRKNRSVRNKIEYDSNTCILLSDLNCITFLLRPLSKLLILSYQNSYYLSHRWLLIGLFIFEIVCLCQKLVHFIYSFHTQQIIKEMLYFGVYQERQYSQSLIQTHKDVSLCIVHLLSAI